MKLFNFFKKKPDAVLYLHSSGRYVKKEDLSKPKSELEIKKGVSIINK